MKPFHTIAVPHRDILEGRLTMDVFAADLWEVYNLQGPAEYKDPELFFQKTYLTEGLKNLLNVVKKRIDGLSGDSVIQIKTPFGGGKTHSLIALLHKARTEWKTHVVVMVGTNLDAREHTLWGVLERQLTGKEEYLKGQVSPGKEKLKNLLSRYQPLLILVDELLEYITKAAGVKVGDSNLSAQTLAFMQELTETVAMLGNSCLVVSLPSSVVEHYDEEAEKAFNSLQKIVGRVEKVYTPVQDNEVAKVIRRRLFSNVNEEEAKHIVSTFLDYAQKEALIPAGVEPIEYRDRFLDSYPFLPDVIDVLYHRWGSIPTFQRTRGVLRLLSLVIYSLKESNISYISLGDFDLKNQELRQELIKHIGPEFNSVIAQDITDINSGSRKVDFALGDAYKGLSLGTRSATTIFMYSFSGGVEKGASILDIKRNATTLNNPSSVITDALELLKERLFYLQTDGDRYYFTNQPNLNRILLMRMENIDEKVVLKEERELLQKSINSKESKFKIYIWEENSYNIPDNEDFKLIILKEGNKELMKEIVRNKGGTPRVNGNTIFFLYPSEHQRAILHNEIRKYLAYKSIDEDNTLTLKEEQRKQVKNKLKELESSLKDSLFNSYRYVGVPDKDNDIEVIDLGAPSYGSSESLDTRVYHELKAEDKISGRIDSSYLIGKYLNDKDYVNTRNILRSFFTTPGEIRVESRKVLEDAIKNAVKSKAFGLGYLEYGGEIKCEYFGEEPKVTFEENEIIIRREKCEELRKKEETPKEGFAPSRVGESEKGETSATVMERPESTGVTTPKNVKNKVSLRVKPAKKNVYSLVSIINYISGKFEDLEVIIRARNGEISEDEYRDKIEETLNQAGFEYEEWE